MKMGSEFDKKGDLQFDFAQFTPASAPGYSILLGFKAAIAQNNPLA
jgi:hypothetical protein